MLYYYTDPIKLYGRWYLSMAKKIIVHYLCGIVRDYFTTKTADGGEYVGRLSNDYSNKIIYYIVRALEAAMADNAAADEALKEEIHHFFTCSDLLFWGDEDKTHVIVLEREEHPATEKEYLATPEGRIFPTIHAPAGDIGSEIIPQLVPFIPFSRVITRAYPYDLVTAEILKEIEADYGRVDQINFYGTPTSPVVAGAAILARAHFQEVEIIVHAKGTAEKSSAAQRSALNEIEDMNIKVQQ